MKIKSLYLCGDFADLGQLDSSEAKFTYQQQCGKCSNSDR